MKEWRSGSSRSLWARPIYEREWPKLIESMIDDGLMAVIQGDGVKWYISGYRLTDTSVCDAWGLRKKQMQRLKDYIIVNDPFVKGMMESES